MLIFHVCFLYSNMLLFCVALKFNAPGVFQVVLLDIPTCQLYDSSEWKNYALYNTPCATISSAATAPVQSASGKCLWFCGVPSSMLSYSTWLLVLQLGPPTCINLSIKLLLRVDILILPTESRKTVHNHCIEVSQTLTDEFQPMMGESALISLWH